MIRESVYPLSFWERAGVRGLLKWEKKYLYFSLRT